MLKAIVDILFPKYCLLCGKPGDSICNYCSRKFIASLPECYKCRRLSTNYMTHPRCLDSYSLDSVFWAWQYNSLSSKFIKTFKYKGSFTMSKEIGDFLTKRILETNFLNQFKNPLFVPIPLHKRREIERGFNQTLLIGELLSRELDIPIEGNLLSRRLYNRAQATKNTLERKTLSEETFRFDWKYYKKYYKEKEIILLDDVITTGTTLEIATRSIKKQDRNIKVSAICLFRGKPNYSSGVPSTCLKSRTTS
jgi:ComF family protein